MYYDYFGLKEAPFRITPHTDFFYPGGNRGAILGALIYAITAGEGIIKVTGEVGSGKTMLCRMLEARLPNHIETVYLANPSVSPAEILHAIAYELQLPVTPDAPRLQVLQILQKELLERHVNGQRVVIFVEEAQSMALATLEEIRLLSNLETQRDKLLQIILFGQPELNKNLALPEIRQLKERITHSFNLGPLDTGAIRDYLGFRLRAAGYHGPDLFDPATTALIAKASQGLIRRVNIIADKALLAAFAESTHTIEAQHIKAAIQDSEFSTGFAWNTWWPIGAALILVGGAIAFGLIQAKSSSGTVNEGNVSAPSTLPAEILTNPDSKGATESLSLPATIPKQSKAGQEHSLSATPSSPPATEATSDLGNLVVVTRKWLTEQNPNIHTIQIMGTHDRDKLQYFLTKTRLHVDEGQFFVYPTQAKGKPYMTLLYGSFPNRREAIKALSQLPPPLKAYRPFVRTVGGIRAELSQYNLL